VQCVALISPSLRREFSHVLGLHSVEWVQWGAVKGTRTTAEERDYRKLFALTRV